MKKFLLKLLTIFIGVVVSLFLCEIVLRIYNPFQSRVRGNEIILKSNYKRNVVIEPAINGLDKQITYSTNSLGFRGPEPPKNWNDAVTIITVGGSTTECSLLSDDSTWSAQLFNQLKQKDNNIWLNNAGLDGCSTYGHNILMRDYIVKLKPDYVVFLIGINDLVKSSFQNEDGFLINRKESFMRKLLKKSELFTLIANLIEASKSQKANVAHGKDPYEYKNNELNNPDSSYRMGLENNLKTMIPDYVIRIKELSKQCKDAGIKPIFVTQPKFDDSLSYSWKVMERYNLALIDYCNHEGFPVIDLGLKMPKEVSLFYDQIHYTNKGARTIADILMPDIYSIIKK
ncbi:MAG: SGNH/GDSL hydrolase family protein [Bacteroidia bacterium]|nr:SGNH/GDSL hydrolase family protein [Bacteroidia bacterium]